MISTRTAGFKPSSIVIHLCYKTAQPPLLNSFKYGHLAFLRSVPTLRLKNNPGRLFTLGSGFPPEEGYSGVDRSCPPEASQVTESGSTCPADQTAITSTPPEYRLAPDKLRYCYTTPFPCEVHPVQGGIHSTKAQKHRASPAYHTHHSHTHTRTHTRTPTTARQTFTSLFEDT